MCCYWGPDAQGISSCEQEYRLEAQPCAVHSDTFSFMTGHPYCRFPAGRPRLPDWLVCDCPCLTFLQVFIAGFTPAAACKVIRIRAYCTPRWSFQISTDLSRHASFQATAGLCHRIYPNRVKQKLLAESSGRIGNQHCYLPPSLLQRFSKLEAWQEPCFRSIA